MQKENKPRHRGDDYDRTNKLKAPRQEIVKVTEKSTSKNLAGVCQGQRGRDEGNF